MALRCPCEVLWWISTPRGVSRGGLRHTLKQIAFIRFMCLGCWSMWADEGWSWGVDIHRNGETRVVPGCFVVISYDIGCKWSLFCLHVDLCDIAWTNAPEVIARNPSVAAVNACLEVDLTGQVVSSTHGSKIYSGKMNCSPWYCFVCESRVQHTLLTPPPPHHPSIGVGGQEDFIRGASWSENGKPILCMSSLTPSGESAIRPFLTKGAAVLCSRALVRYIVTEYGIAYLFGKNLRQRAHALINIAHPDFR